MRMVHSASTLQVDRTGLRPMNISLTLPPSFTVLGHQVGANTPTATKKSCTRKGQGRSSKNQSASQLLVLQQWELAETLTAGVPDGQGAEGKVSR